MNASQRFIELVPFAFWDHFAIKLTEIPDQMEPVSTPGPNLLKFYKYKNLVNLQLQLLPVSFHIRQTYSSYDLRSILKIYGPCQSAKLQKTGPRCGFQGQMGSRLFFIFVWRIILISIKNKIRI